MPDDYPEEYPNDDCECAHDFVMDKNSGRNIGNCLTKLNGKYWCYVSSDSKCSDKKPSARKPSLAFSFEACEGKIKDEPFPLIAGRRKKGNGKIKGKGKGSRKANSGDSRKKGRKLKQTSLKAFNSYITSKSMIILLKIMYP